MSPEQEDGPEGPPSPNVTPQDITAPRQHDIEVVDRLAAIRLIADQYLQGRWLPTERGLHHLAGIATWAARHQWATDLGRRAA